MISRLVLEAGLLLGPFMTWHGRCVRIRNGD